MISHCLIFSHLIISLKVSAVISINPLKREERGFKRDEGAEGGRTVDRTELLHLNCLEERGASVESLGRSESVQRPLSFTRTRMSMFLRMTFPAKRLSDG